MSDAPDANPLPALRADFLRLFERGFRRFEDRKPGGGAAVYRSSAATLAWLCGERWAQETLFAAESALVHRFLAAAGIDAARAAVALRENLAVNSLAAAWRGAPGALAGAIAAEGEPHLERALAVGRGVVLAQSRTPFGWLLAAWLQGRGIQPAAPAEGAGCMILDADGVAGSGSTAIAFFGRRRRIGDGFADVALRAGAPVLPVAVRAAASGDITIDIGAPLEGADAREPRRALVDDYARRLRELWSAHPENIGWPQLELYARLQPESA